MWLADELLNGTSMVIGTVPTMTVLELQRLIKELHAWEDEFCRRRTVVAVILGPKKLGNLERIADLGLSSESTLSVFLRRSVARCSD